uniref:Zinc finger protein CONSTANS-LIKE 2 n=1 Tax=Noccaea caerulescens TaxID=107243 RepID=A0A1J3FNB5_NOCCA
MLKEEESDESGTWGRACDTCRSAASTVYCEADSAYLCTTCDARVHSANPVASRHERVRVCQSCESAPAAFLCKADAASLCTACDAHIHSANPLARRHQRVPILPISTDNRVMAVDEEDEDEDEDDREVASWLLPNRGKNSNNGFLFGVEYLDLVDYSMDNQFEDQYSQYQRSFGGDGVVPLQVEESTTGGHLQVDITVPRTLKERTIEQESTHQMVQQLGPKEREARVLRYREKKKTRKFDKTIRYASRKAYAEIRPRIKGRFAKRKETEADDAQQLSLISDTGYGIVPSFSNMGGH